MPRPEIVDQAIQEISKSTANYRYFFERLNSPAWLAPLAAKGRFSNPPARVEHEDGLVSFPGWPESRYLARMAQLPEAQEQVLRIVRAIPETDNIAVHADLMDIALALPADLASQMANQACAWVQNAINGTIQYKIGDLIAHLAAGGQPQAALQIAEAALALEPETPPEGREASIPPEPRAHLRDWHYEEILKKALPALIAADKEHAFMFVCDLLDRAVTLSRRSDEDANQDYSNIWHPAIERDEQPSDVRNTIVSTVRDAAETIANNDPQDLGQVLAELRRHRWPVFKRIELHLLNTFSTTGMPEIIPIALRLAAVEPATRHEAARLLKTAFGQLPRTTQEEVLQWIYDRPEEEYVTRWLTGQATTDEARERVRNRWRAERFALLADQVPEDWKERVDAVMAAAGETRQLDAIDDGYSWVGPTSPKSAEEFEQIGPAATLEFLRTWEAPHGHLVDTYEGLGRVLGEAVTKNPTGYVEHAAEFQALDPTFVRFFFSGLEAALRERRAFTWEPVLDLAHWVLTQPREIPGRKTGIMEADESWQWTRGAIASLLEHGLNQRTKEDQPPAAPLPFTERDRIWAVIEPLTHDPDPTPEHEEKYGGDNMDPPTLALNSVRGKAMDAVIAYASWTRRNLDQLPEPPAMTFAAMPEVQEVLDDRLDIAQEPSLAIRSTYGTYFPWLHFLDPTWTNDALPRIFPDAFPALYAAAWEAYLTFCRHYKALLPVLERQYTHAVKELAKKDSKKNRGASPAERLAEHLMLFYWWGQLTLDSPLIQDFFRLAPEDVREHAVDFLGRQLAHDLGTPLSDEVLERLRALWESRMEAAQEPSRGQPQELSPFGWWFSSQRFDAAWSFAQLKNVLTVAKRAEPAFKVAETLERLAPSNPLECVQAVRLMVTGDKKGWELYSHDAAFKKILTTALATGDARAKAAADDLIQYFVAKGQFSYRDLLK